MGNNPGFATLPMHSDEVQPLMLRLRNGSSDDSDTFIHRPRTPSAVATVGASLGCDWTVRGAGVPAVAFAIRSDGGMLSLCPSPGATVFVDGVRTPQQWRPIGLGNRIDVGLMRVEVLPSDIVHVEREDPTDSIVYDTVLDSRPSLPEMACVLGRAVKRRVKIPWAMLASVTASAALYVLLLNALD